MTFYEGALYLLNERQGKIFQLSPESGKIISSYNLPDGGKERYEGISFKKISSTEHEMILVAEENAVWVFRLIAKLNEQHPQV